MPASKLQAFKAELRALDQFIGEHKNRTLRDDQVRDRFRNLYRSWIQTVEPGVKGHLQTKRELHKLTAEIERLAKLTSKYAQVSEYKTRLRRAIQFVDSLAVYLPSSTELPPVAPPSVRPELFSPEIPDLPLSLVPSSILGWKRNLESFLKDYPFEHSVFIMIRYRRRNESLINSLKGSLANCGLSGILASEHHITDDLYNAVACLLCCSKGLGVFDRPEKSEKFNPNVAYELGMMHLLGRPCLLLKHQSLQTLQTDILMKLYTPYSTPSEAARETELWAARVAPELELARA